MPRRKGTNKEQNIGLVSSNTETDDYLRFRLPEALKERFKLYCYLKNVTMSDVVRDMIIDLMGSEDIEGLLKAKLHGENALKTKEEAIA